MKQHVILGGAAAILATTLAAPASADHELRTLRQILNAMSQLDRGYGHAHRHRAYHDDDDDGWSRGFHHRRFGRDDDDDDRGRRAGRRGEWNDDDD